MRLRLFGDSIFRGWAVVTRPDLLSEEEARAVPLWPLRAPAAVINLALGEEAAEMVRRLRLPKFKGSARDIRTAVATGQIAPGDTVIMEDVGIHSRDPQAHQEGWTWLRAAATQDCDVRLLICEGFDDGAGGQETHQYDRQFGGRSMNQAMRAAALEPHPEWAGRTEFVPMSRPMTDYGRWLGERFGVAAYHPDGIHLNVWGQFRLCGVILGAVLPDARPARDRLMQQLAPLEPHLELKGNDLAEAIEAAFAPAETA